MSLMRKIFGPSKEEVWNQLCQEIGAEFVRGGFWKGDRVEVRVGEWTIVLDTYAVSTGKTTVVFTRMRAPFVNPEGFQFKLYQAGVFSELGKFFGMQDITIGDAAFDEAYIIKGNNPETIRQLFANEMIRRLVQGQPHISFEVKDDEGAFGKHFPAGVDELYFQVPGIITDVDRLKALYLLFAEVLNQLCMIGSAYTDDPQVTL